MTMDKKGSFRCALGMHVYIIDGDGKMATCKYCAVRIIIGDHTIEVSDELINTQSLWLKSSKAFFNTSTSFLSSLISFSLACS